jgi:hypothetical protein
MVGIKLIGNRISRGYRIGPGVTPAYLARRVADVALAFVPLNVPILRIHMSDRSAFRRLALISIFRSVSATREQRALHGRVADRALDGIAVVVDMVRYAYWD